MNEIIEKIDFVRGLNNVKLIIGNGFDLQCKLKTKYSDYFKHDEIKNHIYLEWINKFTPKAKLYTRWNVVNHKDFWVDFPKEKLLNIWDVFFYLNSDLNENDDVKWCDIELTMLRWFYNSSDHVINNYDLNWDTVYKIIEGQSVNVNGDKCHILASVVYKLNGETPFADQNAFYIFLLNQLKTFEKGFGKYIYNQHFDDSQKSFGMIKKDFWFDKYAMHTILTLCDIKKLVSIDSFNYDIIDNKFVYDKFHNINGDWDDPIFGIDSNTFIAPDIRYIFTKTNRRMEQEMNKSDSFIFEDFNNIVIYGHSLNEADYSYFFSVFDKIDIANPSNPSKIVFAFSVYDENIGDKIKMDLRTAIFKMFNKYSKYKGSKEEPNRLLDILTSFGKIVMYQIPTLDKVMSFYSIK